MPPLTAGAMLIVRLLVILAAVWLVAVAVRSAVRTLVLPRAALDPITSTVFLVTRKLFDLRVRKADTYAERDAIMAYYAPVSLLLLVPAWLILVLTGFAGLFWATSADTWEESFSMSGSSLFTLGFKMHNSGLHMLLSFVEAGLGLMFVALLVGYLPTMYSAFSAREAAVNLLDVRAGTPPTVAVALKRLHGIRKLDSQTSFWREWEILFTQLAETHTTLPALVFFRSPTPERSWVTAAGNVMDTAAFVLAAVDVPHDPQADLCIRAGFLTLRQIADYFGFVYPADPHFPADPISIDRGEFEAVYDELAAAGVPLKADRDLAWQAFAGWRVNYDSVLLSLCALTMAPYAPWSSDRSRRVRSGLRRNLSRLRRELLPR